MKRSNLAAVGIALTIGLAAQAAEAGSVQCPIGGGEGGGGQQNEVGQEGGPSCEPQVTYTPLSVMALDANGTAYTVASTAENGDELLEPGEVVEVEIDLDDIMASLKANEQDAVVLAAASGVHRAGSKAGVVDAGNTAKLSEAEFESVAKYFYVSLQNGRATGRSDPAGSSTTRFQALGQAMSRLMSAVGSAVLRGPGIGSMRETIRHPNGAVKTERDAAVEISPVD